MSETANDTGPNTGPNTGEAQPPRKRPSGLGRGLSALLGEIQTEAPVSVGQGASADSGRGQSAAALQNGIRMVEIGHLSPLPGQPRNTFAEAPLAELANSILTRGLLQPIVVRPRGDRFQIVAGERRWRAAQIANLHEVPVIIRDFDDSAALEIALIENIQREQLNAIEEGDAFRRLIADYGHSQAKVADLVNKSRSHVANLVRLLDLPEKVRAAIADGRLSMGHARALVTAEDPAGLMMQVLERGLSVRETERLAKHAKAGAARPKGAARDADPDLAALERQLGDMLGLRVHITHGHKGGTVMLSYSSLDQLDMICQRLSGEKI